MTEAPLASEPETAPEPARERWIVPFVVIPLGIALCVLAIIGGANFLLGRFESRSIDRLLEDVQTGGANTRKQAAFHLARDLAELVEESNRKMAAGGGGASNGAPHAVLPRERLTKIERAYELAKGDLEARHFLIHALGLVGDEATAEFLARQIESPDEPDPDGSRRVWTLFALAKIASATSVPLFRKELTRLGEGDADRGVATVLAAAFGNVPGPEGTEGLRRILELARTRGTDWKLVEVTVAVNLAKRSSIDPEAGKEAVPVLLEGLKLIHGDAFRDSGKLFGGATSGSPFATATRQGDYNREDAALQVISALVLLRATEAVPTLREVAEKDPSYRIKSEALKAIGAL